MVLRSKFDLLSKSCSLLFFALELESKKKDFVLSLLVENKLYTAQYLNHWKKLPKKNFHGLLYTVKQWSIRCDSFMNFIVVAVFIDCSSSLQYHYRGHACYNFGDNFTPNKIWSHQMCSIKRLLKILQYSHENSCVGVSFWKLQA